jgi:hypothetical protein
MHIASRLTSLACIVLLPLLARADDVDDLRKKFLGDSAVSSEIKQAIQKRIVVRGMCPQQAFAAAGLPGLYKVQADPKWKPSIPPPVIISAQCDHPDKSVIELLFRSKTQFATKDLVVFRVRFENGQAVSIDRKKISFP